MMALRKEGRRSPWSLDRFGGENRATCASQLVSLSVIAWMTLFGIKCVIAYRDLSPSGFPPLIYDGRLVASAARIVLCSAEDLCVCLVFLAIGLAINRLLSDKISRRAFLVVACCIVGLALAYSVVNIQHYHVLRRFLNLPLLRFSGGLKLERSIYSFATPGILAASFLVPVGAIGAYVLTWPLLANAWLRVSAIVCRPIVLALLIGLGFCGSQFAQVRWFPPDNREFARNPHWLFVRSCFWVLGFGDTPKPLASDMDDFKPAGNTASGGVARPFVPRNIIVVVLESVSIPYLQVYGSSWPTTPQLCAMGDHSVVMRNIYSNAAHTAASGLGLFGSRYNDPSGSAVAMDHPSYAIPSGPDWLRKHGFRTYFLSGGDWDYNNLGPTFLSNGFDLARDAYRHWSKDRRDWEFAKSDYDDRQLFSDAVRCLKEARDQPFFLMLWTYDSHSPYRPVPCIEPFTTQELPHILRAAGDHRLLPNQATYPGRIGEFRRFLATVRQADALIASLCLELDRLELADSTLLVITGDHGDAFGEHGWFCHGHALFEEDVHVPMIFVSPRMKEIAWDADMIGSHVDLWPTLADLCDIPPHPLWQGRSLLQNDPGRRAYFFRPGSLGIREGRYKYIWDYVSGREYLFDLLADPAESVNVAVKHPELCLTERRRLRSWTEFQSKWAAGLPTQSDEK